MRSIERAAGALLFVAGIAIAGSASAAAIVDVVTGGPTLIKVGSPYSFTHYFTDQPDNYTAGLDTITSAGLVIVLTDDNGNENYAISFGTPSQVNNFTANIPSDTNTSFSFSILALSLADLSAKGTLGVTISATACNGNDCASHAFKFVSSTLTADVTRSTLTQPTIAAPTIAAPTNAVPEPGTLALLGLGLAGIAALRRGRSPRKASPSA